MNQAYLARWARIALTWAGLVGLLVLITAFWSGSAHASTMECPADSGLDTATAIHAIANEAGESYAEQRAVAWALANRVRAGMGTRGVYGLNVPLRASNSKYEACLRAWTELGEDNRGADHWLSDYDLKHCKPSLTAFRFKMREVGYFGSTHFYKSN